MVGVDSSPQMLGAARRSRTRRPGRVGARPTWPRGTAAWAAPRRHRHQRHAAVGARAPRPPARLGRAPGAGWLVRHAGAGQLRRALARAACGRWPRPRRVPSELTPAAARRLGRGGPGHVRRDAGRPRLRASTCGRRRTCTCWTPRARRRRRCWSGPRARPCARCCEVLTDERERAAFLAAYARGCARHTRAAVRRVFPFRRIFAVAQRAGRPA